MKMAIRFQIAIIVFVVCAAHLVTCADPYRTLGISRRAGTGEIRRAYKKLAREWHPDKNRDSNAEAKFIQIKNAYELLSDERRRKDYDQFGITEPRDERGGFSGHYHPHQHQHFQQFVFRGRPPNHFFHGFHRQRTSSLWDSSYLLVLLALLTVFLMLPAGARDGQNQRDRRYDHYDQDEEDEQSVGSGARRSTNKAREPTQRPCSNSSQSRICPPLDAHSFSKFENLPSGHFLLVLLLNEEPVNGEHTLDESLLSAFLATTESYDRDRKYSFMYLVLSQHSAWCEAVAERLDEDSLTVAQSHGILDWRPGVVLALNARKCYFSVFQPIADEHSRAEDDGVEDFLGLSDPDWQAGAQSRSAEEAVSERLASDLRGRLGLWVDRHNDGLVPRLRISEWPRIR